MHDVSLDISSETNSSKKKIIIIIKTHQKIYSETF